MGFFSRTVQENRHTIQEYTREFYSGNDIHTGGPTAAGVDVNEAIAATIAAVYSCVRLLSWTMAAMPLSLYVRGPDGKQVAEDDPLHRLVHNSPNQYMTSFQWRQIMGVYMNLWGAGISEIEFNPRTGAPVALWPIPTSLVTAKYDKTIGPYYVVRDPSGGPDRVLGPHQLIIYRMMTASLYGWTSPVAVHRETLGSAIAVKTFGARTFGQGINPSVVIKHPTQLSPQGAQDLKAEIKEAYSGLSKAHRAMVLEYGMEIERIGLPPEDAQYLQTRRFDISEIARIWNVPLFMLQDHEKQTSWGSGIEEQNIGFVTYTMLPVLVQCEQELAFKLLDDPRYYFKHNVNALLRGKMLERYQAYAIARQWGLNNADECRDHEDENAIPEGAGQTYINPMNMINAIYTKEYDPLSNKQEGGNA